MEFLTREIGCLPIPLGRRYRPGISGNYKLIEDLEIAPSPRAFATDWFATLAGERVNCAERLERFGGERDIVSDAVIYEGLNVPSERSNEIWRD